MTLDDPMVHDVLRRSMVARIATLSRTGRPSITPLYFVSRHGRIWLGTTAWTLAARHVAADPRVSILFAMERDPWDHRVVLISGRARVRADQQALRSYDLRVARKYVLTPGAVLDALVHLRQLPPRRRYRAQSAEKGRPCVIEVTSEQAGILDHDQGG
jgi:predicted pyridoxine 5'-phosphate oxidase superfamily flavin-nucleotide-binding protein